MNIGLFSFVSVSNVCMYVCRWMRRQRKHKKDVFFVGLFHTYRSLLMCVYMCVNDCYCRGRHEGQVCVCQKRPKCMKRDVHIRTNVRASKETYLYEKRPKSMKRDLNL